MCVNATLALLILNWSTPTVKHTHTHELTLQYSAYAYSEDANLIPRDTFIGDYVQARNTNEFHQLYINTEPSTRSLAENSIRWRNIRFEPIDEPSELISGHPMAAGDGVLFWPLAVRT